VKRILFIAAVLLGLGVVSCQKQDVAPNADARMNVPTWELNDNADNAKSNNNTSREKIEGGNDENGSHENGSNGTGGGTIDDPTNPKVNDGDITDPNLDPDAG